MSKVCLTEFKDKRIKITCIIQSDIVKEKAIPNSLVFNNEKRSLIKLKVKFSININEGLYVWTNGLDLIRDIAFIQNLSDFALKFKNIEYRYANFVDLENITKVEDLLTVILSFYY